jgi:hypothetical protein
LNLKSLLLFIIIFISRHSESYSQVGFPYCEKFDGNSTQDATVFGADARLIDGALRLTSNQKDQRGYVYIDIPFSSAYGIKASFEYFSYGGDGADGLTFFLFDAEVPSFGIGGFGGSLGYSKSDKQPGLAGAYLGVGFDEFGNFGNTAEGKSGGFSGAGQNLVPNAIIIRGPGNGFNGYNFQAGKKTMELGTGSNLPDSQFPISSGGIGTQRVTDPNEPGYRKANLTLVPNPTGIGYLITLVVNFTVEQGKPRLYTIFQDFEYPYTAPKNLKLGFSASTGGQTNFHEIKNLLVEVANNEALSNPIGVDFSDFASCEGQENTYSIENEEVELPNENSSIRCLQFYASKNEIAEESGDICAQDKCREENRELIIPEGVFFAGAQGGEYTFFPNYGFIGIQITVFYTITDNYGKSSAGNSMTFKIKESPEPVLIKKVGDQEISEYIRLCGEESVLFLAEGGEEYERYEWYNSDLPIEGAVSESYSASSTGSYYAKAYNTKNCPAVSNRVEVLFPGLPDFDIETPVIGCLPGQSVDITTGILNYNTLEYDYLLIGQGESYENDELKEIFTPGSYQIQIKHKDLDCYSSAQTLQVIILELQLITDFQFEIQGTGVKGEDDGGFFPDDVFQFTDLSNQQATVYEWDFGDGTTSTDKNPTHVFGKKGNFEVRLKITNEYECVAEIVKSLSILRSYRLMVPTGFTPMASDNIHFVPKYKGLVSAELLIFNTWGDLIFQTNELTMAGWDGRLKGELMDAGIYVYKFSGVAVDGEIINSSGKFKLIR